MFIWGDKSGGRESEIRGPLLTKAQRERNSGCVGWGTTGLIGNSFIDSWKHHILEQGFFFYTFL